MAEGPKKKPRPVPVPTNFTKAFWEGTKQGKLLLQRCRACGTHQYYPRPVCMRCISRDLEWKEASGRGTIYSYTVTHLPPEGFEDRAPYVLVSVDLPEGVRVLGTLLGVAAADVRIGMPVRASYERLTDDITLVQFAAERQGGAPA
jgi:uncharacterized OB-fold protein